MRRSESGRSPTPVGTSLRLRLEHVSHSYGATFALDNRGTAEGGLSHAVLMARVKGEEARISTAPNTIVVFEGARISHKVTPILEGERRLMLSMTYCTDDRAYWWQGLSRRLKDTAFYGVRALWT